MAKAKFTEDDDALLDELGVEVEAPHHGSRTSKEERIIAGFEEIQRFFDEHGLPPQHGEEREIFERLYAVRLDRLHEQAECRAILEPLDHQGLLKGQVNKKAVEPDELDDDELLAQLGMGAATPDDITNLKHVRSVADKRAAEVVANRTVCADFSIFQPLFAEVRADLNTGTRETRRFGENAEIKKGEFFILGGQFAYVADVGEEFVAEYGRPDRRLRVIYDNGTESDLLLRSFQRALYKDEGGRRITDPALGPLFGDQWEPDDIESGTIYVLRSHSTHPFVSEHRELIHKIGVTGGKVETRIANAAHDATYLLADVEVVATYKLADINRTKLEGIFHRIFAPAQLDLTLQDRFGHLVRPREWFLVPLHVIDKAVQCIRDGSIAHMTYDVKTASMMKLGQ
ncbi:GIY-YIG nuclease family protein [Granulibacter bethesdensis]|uniref:GIY-YIG nuclease family protein n=1 Tax=Granulibacter bethesdensis TaxID=364410 RepID=UPI00090AD0C7|nr:GIY-YIG nuclease family protein [Granulibacter bethesdensis]APH52251.1 putative cytosolic protein [Granulibacter bethesdensis]